MNQSRKDLYEKLARAGFAARGVTYGLIGVLAFMAAIGSGGGTTGSRGALATLSGSTWGNILLGLIAVGLFGYGLWRLCSATFDLENEGSDGKAIAKRLAHAGSGIFHFGLAIAAIGLIGSSGGGGGGGADSMTARLMQAPAGVWLVGALGLGFILAGGSMLKKALNEEYRRNIAFPQGATWMNPAVKFGIISRAVVFAIIGGFLIFAAATTNPDNARGVGGALDWLQNQPFGAIVLGLVGLGLVAFALYSFLQARYRTIPDPEKGAKRKVAQATS